MFKLGKLTAVALTILTLSACGGVHNTVLSEPGTNLVVEDTRLLPVQVRSKETNEDAQALNARWKNQAESQLRSLLSREDIAISESSRTSVRCTIDVTYGNRALRYWVGFGAGSGHIDVTIEMLDGNGERVYAIASEADLGVGLFGGDMASVANKTIDEAVKEFGSRL